MGSSIFYIIIHNGTLRICTQWRSVGGATGAVAPGAKFLGGAKFQYWIGGRDLGSANGPWVRGALLPLPRALATHATPLFVPAIALVKRQATVDATTVRMATSDKSPGNIINSSAVSIVLTVLLVYSAEMAAIILLR